MMPTAVTSTRLSARSFVGGAAPLRPAARGPARRASLAKIAPHAELGKYLADAVSQIFHPQQESDVKWTGTDTPFTGDIQHHERLRAVHEVVKATAKELEQVLASVDEPEETTFTFDEQGKLVEEGSLREYLTGAIGRIFGHHTKGDATEPAAFYSSGYKFSGRLRSKREVQRKFDRLKKFEQVVVEAIEETKTA